MGVLGEPRGVQGVWWTAPNVKRQKLKILVLSMGGNVEGVKGTIEKIPSEWKFSGYD